MHVEVDEGHGSDWLSGLVLPAIVRDPSVGREIALGALLRQRVAEDYCDELLAHFRGV